MNMAVERIAVLGGGNAGRGIAADMTLKGLKVNLFELARFADSFAPVKASGTLSLQASPARGSRSSISPPMTSPKRSRGSTSFSSQCRPSA